MICRFMYMMGLNRSFHACTKQKMNVAEKPARISGNTMRISA